MQWQCYRMKIQQRVQVGGWLELLLKGEGGQVTHQKPVLVGINYFALQFFCSVWWWVSQARGGTIKVPLENLLLGLFKGVAGSYKLQGTVLAGTHNLTLVGTQPPTRPMTIVATEQWTWVKWHFCGQGQLNHQQSYLDGIIKVGTKGTTSQPTPKYHKNVCIFPSAIQEFYKMQSVFFQNVTKALQLLETIHLIPHKTPISRRIHVDSHCLWDTLAGTSNFLTGTAELAKWLRKCNNLPVNERLRTTGISLSFAALSKVAGVFLLPFNLQYRCGRKQYGYADASEQIDFRLRWDM